MASSAFSFHCMICFEEFDPEVNYPVVLPCGHTYVCATCAGRIDMCMECRAPLVARIDVPPPAGGGTCGAAPPPPPAGDPPAGRENNQSGGESAWSSRVRNSPGFRRRYGNQYGLDPRPAGGPPQGGAGGGGQAGRPQQIKHRLPLPKNAVLLSLIQVSEPARRRMEVEAPPTPEKDGGGADGGSRTPSPRDGALPRFSQPSPLFLNGSPRAGGERPGVVGPGDGPHLDLTLGGSLDDEERKIRVGTYLEGGPCGTYAVASKSGLLVYPTLFEHTLPDAMRGDRDNDVARGVEDIVKKHRSRSRGKKKAAAGEERDADGGRRNSLGAERTDFLPGGDGRDDLLHSISEGRRSHETLVEPSASHDAIEARASSLEHDVPDLLPAGLSAMSLSNDEEGDAEFPDVFPPAGGPLLAPAAGRAGGAGAGMERLTAMSDPGLSLSVSLTSDDDDGEPSLDDGDADAADASTDADASADGSFLVDRLNISTRSTPVKRLRSAAISPVKSKDDSSTLRRFARHFTTGHVPGGGGARKSPHGGRDGGEGSDENEFERPLVRLKYGDRVQVVSMDGRGWVKLARGYGYIRLENDKQLVKVGGTSDKACQIEAMLHELSLERTRLKAEQTKLERMSAGLMIDLQSTLLSTSDDHVVVPAPKGSLARVDSDASLSVSTHRRESSKDDIDVSSRSRRVLTPPRGGAPAASPPEARQPREVRMAKSHSPGRHPTLAAGGAGGRRPPPSPPYGQAPTPATPDIRPSPSQSQSSGLTPTRVNFRTGMSGHRALTSSYSHPHDFINRAEGIGRSYSNHAGVSAVRSRGRSLY